MTGDYLEQIGLALNIMFFKKAVAGLASLETNLFSIMSSHRGITLSEQIKRIDTSAICGWG